MASNHERLPIYAGVAMALAVSADARAGAPPGHFTDLGDGTVKDNATSLVWQRDLADGGGKTWAAAKTYCQGLSLGGGGWRLPNVKELQTLGDDSTYNPTIDVTYFPSTPSTYFWSSSVSALDNSSAWVVDFAYGDVLENDQTNSFRVRCVR